MTKDQLQDENEHLRGIIAAQRLENERLGKEVAALRVLLRAANAAASVPFPAGDDDAGWRKYLNLCSLRIGVLSVYASPDIDGAPVLTESLHHRAEALRKEAARPLRYTPQAAEPADAQSAPAGMQSPAPVVRVAGRSETVVHDCGGSENCFCGADEQAAGR